MDKPLVNRVATSGLITINLEDFFPKEELMVFDITDAGNVRVGDTITLIGTDGDEQVTVEEHAEIAGTISHEIVTGITGRVSRAFIPAT